jgi:hypothetical protein
MFVFMRPVYHGLFVAPGMALTALRSDDRRTFHPVPDLAEGAAGEGLGSLRMPVFASRVSEDCVAPGKVRSKTLDGEK